jgi:START domain
LRGLPNTGKPFKASFLYFLSWKLARMKRFAQCLVYYLTLLHSSLLFAETSTTLDENASAWQLSKTENNVQVYTQPYSDSKFEAFKAISILNQSIESIFAVLSDPPSCPLWVDNCVKSNAYKKNGIESTDLSDRYGYSLNKLPWPFKNRDLIVHILTSNRMLASSNDGIDKQEITISMSSDGPPKDDSNKIVHITDSQTVYILRSITKNQTELVWMQHTEPGGKLPSWLVNTMIVNLPVKSIRALEKTAGLQKYQQAEIKYDTQIQIKSLHFMH